MKKKTKNYWTRLLRTVRQEWSRHNYHRKECFLNARCESRIGGIGRFLDKWICNSCKLEFALSEVQCDHIQPVANTIPESYDEFIESFKRLHSTELQILCKGCHSIKSKQDNFNVKYKRAVGSVCLYLSVSEDSVSNLPWKVIQKFDKIISRIREERDDKKLVKLTKEIRDLEKKYL